MISDFQGFPLLVRILDLFVLLFAWNPLQNRLWGSHVGARGLPWSDLGPSVGLPETLLARFCDQKNKS